MKLPWTLPLLLQLVLSLLIINLPLNQAQTIDDLKGGVVKIMVTVGGQQQVGTGFIVNLTETALLVKKLIQPSGI